MVLNKNGITFVIFKVLDVKHFCQFFVLRTETVLPWYAGGNGKGGKYHRFDKNTLYVLVLHIA